MGLWFSNLLPDDSIIKAIMPINIVNCNLMTCLIIKMGGKLIKLINLIKTINKQTRHTHRLQTRHDCTNVNKVLVFISLFI